VEIISIFKYQTCKDYKQLTLYISAATLLVDLCTANLVERSIGVIHYCSEQPSFSVSD